MPPKVKLYRTVTLDCPWPENGGGKIKRGADRHYKTVSVKKLPEIIQSSGVFNMAENSHMYLWVTNNYLEKGLWLVRELGFEYKTLLTWPKKRISIGQYFRGQTEHVIFATHGKGMDESVYTDRRDLSTLLKDMTHERVHSKKPLEFFDVVEARSKGPYLEMFHDHNTPPRKNWSRWGLPRFSDEELAVKAAERRAG